MNNSHIDQHVNANISITINEIFKDDKTLQQNDGYAILLRYGKIKVYADNNNRRIVELMSNNHSLAEMAFTFTPIADTNSDLFRSQLMCFRKMLFAWRNYMRETRSLK